MSAFQLRKLAVFGVGLIGGSFACALKQAGAVIVPTRGLRFLDPWGNSVEVVQYDQVQFSKTGPVLSGMGLGTLGKTEAALGELRGKGLGG